VKPVIYIDTLFLINLIFNMLIFYMSAYILKKETGALRIFLVGTLGALYGVLMFFPKLGLFYTGIFKVLFMVLSAKLLFSSRNIKELIKQSLVCFFVSIGFCGAVCVCLSVTNAAPLLGMVISGGIVYLDIDPLILVFGVMVSLVILIFFSSSVSENFEKEDIIKEFIITAEGESFKVKALVDTGCELYDPSGSLPVLVAERTVIPAGLKNIEKIALKYSSITKENEIIEGFLPQSITDKDGKLFYRAIIAEGRENLDSKGRFDAIVNPAIFSTVIRRIEYEKTV